LTKELRQHGDAQIITMKAISTHTLATVLVLAVAVTFAGQARAGGELVTFPENDAEGVRYAIVERGNLREEIYTSRAAIDAVKNGQPIPSGTVISLVTIGMESCSASS
jgi:hypothetical protein